MQLSGREIQTLWPAGIGWPSVGFGGVLPPPVRTVAVWAGAAGAGGERKYDLLNWSAYAQDTFTHNRATFQLGVRYDYNKEHALASAVGSNPLLPQWLPGITFTGADPGVVQTSDRRWREDEMLLPRALTEGRDAIRIRLVFVPTAKPLVPGGAVGMQGWSEFRYRAFVWRMPPAPL